MDAFSRRRRGPDRADAAMIDVATGAGGEIDPRQLRAALGRFATGVTVITTRTPGGKLEGLTANSFSALSLDPPLVLWSIRRAAPSLDGFIEAGCFAVNVLAAEQRDLAAHFATPRAEKFAIAEHDRGHRGCPVLAGCLATFQCETESTAAGGDHLIFIGRVVHAAYRDGEPLVFCGGQYCVPAPLAPDAARLRA
jgi:flavin reductase (DIM6/NTAB) family NADH-FMN oxidoreductase RutF